MGKQKPYNGRLSLELLLKYQVDTLVNMESGFTVGTIDIASSKRTMASSEDERAILHVIFMITICHSLISGLKPYRSKIRNNKCQKDIINRRPQELATGSVLTQPRGRNYPAYQLHQNIAISPLLCL